MRDQEKEFKECLEVLAIDEEPSQVLKLVGTWVTPHPESKSVSPGAAGKALVEIYQLDSYRNLEEKEKEAFNLLTISIAQLLTRFSFTDFSI